MPHIPEDIQTPMLLAVDLFDEAHEIHADGTRRDYICTTYEFWKAMAVWAPHALVGNFDMDMDSVGNVTIRFVAKTR